MNQPQQDVMRQQVKEIREALQSGQPLKAIDLFRKTGFLWFDFNAEWLECFAEYLRCMSAEQISVAEFQTRLKHDAMELKAFFAEQD